jgi:hypothetical protein
LGDNILIFNYAKLVKVKPYQGRKRIVEESEGEDSDNESLLLIQAIKYKNQKQEKRENIILKGSVLLLYI